MPLIFALLNQLRYVWFTEIKNNGKQRRDIAVL
jgi:hypothetical protein